MPDSQATQALSAATAEMATVCHLLLQALPVPVAGGIDRPYLFLSGHPRARSRVCLFGLHFQDCAEQLL